jgi:hypothetical protein
MILGWTRVDGSGGRHRKSWLLDVIVSGFYAEARHFTPSIGKGRLRLCRFTYALYCSPAFQLPQAIQPVCLVPCGPSAVLCFDELAAAALGYLSIYNKCPETDLAFAHWVTLISRPLNDSGASDRGSFLLHR